MSEHVPADPRASDADGGWKRATWAVLVVAAILRIALVLQGGQFFFPDESRYNEARGAAALIAAGNLRQGLAAPFEGGDHAGFKLLGVVPALLERWLGAGERLPALFFAAFSLGNVLLPGLIAGRLGAPAAARFWVTLASAASATLYYYCRHLLPYDASMFFSLLALHLALGPKTAGVAWQLPLAGLSAGCGTLIYYGYWESAGLALALGVVFGARPGLDVLRRAAPAAAGLAIPFLAAWTVNRAWGSGQFVDMARNFAKTISSGGDYRGSIVPFEFLWKAEGLWFLAAATALLAAAWRWAGRGRTGAPAAPAEKLAIAACALLWAAFVVTGDVLHKFVVYGRLARQFTPFLALALGLASAAAWSGPRRRWVLVAWAALGLNAAWFMGRALALGFPVDFRATWTPVIERKQRELGAADSYYRLVNVNHYIDEPETLEGPPLETLAAAAHPFSFVPYLYEGFSMAERARWLAIDHRMLAVRMAVPSAARVAGEPSGLITLGVKFPPHRGGFADPLLSVGSPGAGDLFFVRYETDTRVRIGCEVLGSIVFLGEPQSIQPGRIYRLQCYGDALDPGPPAAAATRRQIWAALDGQTLFKRRFAAPPVKPAPVYAGVNVVAGGSAGSRFHGEILDVRRGGLPPPLPEIAIANEYGAVKIIVTPPESRNNRPEPLVVAGDIGRAVLGYIVPLADGRVALGAEIWGVGTKQSAPFVLRGDGTDEIVYEFGSLLPPPGDPAWADTPAPQQVERIQHLRIWLNQAVVLDVPMETPDLMSVTVAIGKNPLGGSFVGESYSGRVVSSARLPVTKRPP